MHRRGRIWSVLPFGVLGTTFVVAVMLRHEVPVVILMGYLVLSVVSFVVYALDKRAAQRGASRTPESALHLLALAGGWPGALVAQRVFRHKTVKQPFRRIFWLTVVANYGVLLYLLFVPSR